MALSGQYRTGRLTGLLIALSVGTPVLIWLASAGWSSWVDDVFISITYAHEWVSSGVLRFSTGEVVEGYSNFLWVLLLAAGELLGLDLGLLSKHMSMSSSVAALALVGWSFRSRWAGASIALGLALWEPFSFWASQGMETPLYALLIALGWRAFLIPGGWSRSVVFLVLAALARPEGLGLLAAVIVGRVAPWQRGPQPAALGWGALGALALYHCLRVWHFGHIVPAPLLVKVSGVPWSAYGFHQASSDVLSASGLLIAAAAAARPRSGRMLLWCLVPLLFQALVLGRASGDWMAHGRIILPGVVASLACLPLASRTGSPPLWQWLVVVIGLGWTAVQRPGAPWLIDLQRRDLPTSVDDVASAYSRGLDTPLDHDVIFVASHLADGDSFMVVDAGMLSTVPHTRLVDMRGLTHRAMAEAMAKGEDAAFIEAILAPGDPTVDWIRWARWDSSLGSTIPSIDADRWWLVEQLDYASGSTLWYTSTKRRAGAELVAVRLSELAERFPSQPLLTQHAVRALMEIGALDRARELSERARTRWPTRREFTDGIDAAAFTHGSAPLNYQPGRGFALYWNARLVSAPLPRSPSGAVTLNFDQDPAGDEPARALVEVLGDCAESQTVEVAGPTAIRLSLETCPGEQPVRIAVEFINDFNDDSGDRNLYVQLPLGKSTGEAAGQ